MILNLGQDCDLLIHEATFENDRVNHARKTNHSTTSQAIQIGKRMKAKNIILTHFNSTFFHTPQNDIEGVGVAFDHMKVSINLESSGNSQVTLENREKIERYPTNFSILIYMCKRGNLAYILIFFLCLQVDLNNASHLPHLYPAFKMLFNNKDNNKSIKNFCNKAIHGFN